MDKLNSEVSTLEFTVSEAQDAIEAARNSEDPEIAGKARADAERLFAIIYYETIDETAQYTRKITGGDLQATEAILQETYTRAFKSLPSYHGDNDASIATWLCTIARNRTRTYWKKQARQNEHEASIHTAGPDEATLDYSLASLQLPFDEAYVLSEVIQQAIDELQPKYRFAFIARHVIGLSNREIADHIGKTESGAKVQVHRARKFLQAALRPLLEDG